MNRLSRAYVVAVATVVLSGCGESNPETPNAESSRQTLATAPNSSEIGAVPESQQAAFADETVSFEEYEKAVLEYKGCVESEGVELENFGLIAAERVYEWQLPGEDFESPTDLACYSEHLSAIDPAWQISVREQQRAAGNDPERDRLLACLKDSDLEFDPESTSAELAILLLENGIDRFSC